jgi:hypothetical protein
MSGDHNRYCSANQPTKKDKQAIRREWVSLTDEEIHDEALKLMREHKTGYMGIARAVEAMLKERNNA